jgi:cytochrome c assembly protein
MFDLESQITSWRESFNRQKVDEQTLAELESHLRDAYRKLHRGDVAPEQAWQQAVAELGEPTVIADEFRKSAKQFWWWPQTFAVCLVALSASAVMVQGLLRGKFTMDWILMIHVQAVTTGYVAMFAVGALAFCAMVQQMIHQWDARRDAALHSFGFKLSALAVFCVGAGILLGMVWSGRNRHAYWSWDPREVGSLLTLLWATCQMFIFRNGAAPTRLVVGSGLVANIVTALAWFGPVTIDSHHSYGHDTLFGPGLGLFLVIQLVLIGGLFLLPKKEARAIKAG